MNKENLIRYNFDILVKYIPSQAAEIISKWIWEYRIRLIITRGRQTKLGDYTYSGKKKLPCITVNHNLNPYAFLITLIHEFAHHFTFMKYGNSVAPHGKEWKTEFKNALYPLINLSVFPPDVLHALNRHLTNPSASSCSDPFLHKVLSSYDQTDDAEGVPLEYLPVQSLFTYRQKIFRKEHRRRKLFLCTCCTTKKKFLFQPFVRVVPLENQ